MRPKRFRNLSVQLLERPTATLVSSSESPNFKERNNACATRDSLIVFACVIAALTNSCPSAGRARCHLTHRQ